MIEAAYPAGVGRCFFSSLACVYNVPLQQDPNVRALKESDAYPAMAKRGYGWKKSISSMFCQEYWAEREAENVRHAVLQSVRLVGAWDGGREKAPAAICRKVLGAIDTRGRGIMIWGDGQETHQFMYIDD